MRSTPQVFQSIKLNGHRIKSNGWPTDHAETVEFRGYVLVNDHVGFRGHAQVYKTDAGSLVFVYQQNAVPGLVINILPDLEAAAQLVWKEYPEFDPELLAKAATVLGVEVPARPIT